MGNDGYSPRSEIQSLERQLKKIIKINNLSDIYEIFKNMSTTETVTIELNYSQLGDIDRTLKLDDYSLKLCEENIKGTIKKRKKEREKTVEEG